MKRLILATALVSMGTGLSAQRPQADHHLDIPGENRSSASPAAPFVPTGPSTMTGQSHREFATVLKLTLVSVDVSEFAWGDHFVYEVLIENTGKLPVTLPWSPDMGAFAQPVKRTPPGFRSGTLRLQVEPANAPGSVLAFLDHQALYGSLEVPRSLLVLPPGKTALVRVPAQWSATMQEGRAAVLGQPDGAVRIRAILTIYDDDVPLTRSTNTLPIRVQPRPLR